MVRKTTTIVTRAMRSRPGRTPVARTTTMPTTCETVLSLPRGLGGNRADAECEIDRESHPDDQDVPCDHQDGQGDRDRDSRVDVGDRQQDER